MIESAACTLAKELVSRREEINRELSRNDVRSGVYKYGEYHDRLFPMIPCRASSNPMSSTVLKQALSSVCRR